MENFTDWSPGCCDSKNLKAVLGGLALCSSEWEDSSQLLSAPHRCVRVFVWDGHPHCQWRHRCVVTLGKFPVVLYSEPLWRKEKWKQRRKGDVRDVKNYHRRCWKTGKGITAMTLQKRGYELRCEKIALCIAAFCVAALWCTKVSWQTMCMDLEVMPNVWFISLCWVMVALDAPYSTKVMAPNLENTRKRRA